MTSYYDIGAANEQVERLRPLLLALREDRDAVAAAQQRLRALQSMGAAGQSADGEAARESEQERLTTLVRRMEASVQRIDAWGITLRDIGSGLVDFPALANGRPIWLCWRLGEGDIAYWHELQAGLAGRRPLIELE